MSLPVTFGPLTTVVSGQLDTNFAAVAALMVVPCTATGTNAISLSGNLNTPTISAYADFIQFSFVAAATSTGAVTVEFGSLGFLPLYLPDGATQAGANSVIATAFYQIAYDDALNGGGGGFMIVSMMPISSALDGIGSTVGNLLYRDTAAWEALNPGAGGQFLETQGPAANPAWATIALALTQGSALTVTPLTSALTLHSSQLHNLGATPSFLLSYIECLSTDVGWNVGDRLYFSSDIGIGQTFSGITATGVTPSLFVAANASSIYLLHPIAGLTIPPKSGSAGANLNPSSWKAVVIPYLA